MSLTSKRKREVRRWARETPKARRKRLEAARFDARAWRVWVTLSSIHTRLMREHIAATADAMSRMLAKMWPGVLVTFGTGKVE